MLFTGDHNSHASRIKRHMIDDFYNMLKFKGLLSYLIIDAGQLLTKYSFTSNLETFLC